MKTNIICVLDKEYPPNHSFVDGMLSKVLPNKNISVILVVSNNGSERIAEKYYHSECNPVLLERKGIKRFLNFFVLYKFLRKRINQLEPKERIVLFIRNEPIYLLTAGLLRNKVNKLVFQQSFPHEKANIHYLKKKITLLIFKLISNRVDSLLTVSPKALERLKSYFPNTKDNMYIPLLVNEEELIASDKIKLLQEQEPIKFLYVGTHDYSRRLDVVLDGIILALLQGVNATFTFIGGNQQDIENLRTTSNLKRFEENGKIVFKDKFPRDQLLIKIREYDVGFSIIPKNEIYAESSPTKLVEYMSNGLMVIGSNGIDLQEKFIKESKGGILVDFTKNDVAEAIRWICNNREKINPMKKNALEYAKLELLYENYVDKFRDQLTAL